MHLGKFIREINGNSKEKWDVIKWIFFYLCFSIL